MSETRMGHRVVAVLSGGGAKAVAHLGAVRVLTEAGLAPSHYVATSMGAVIAAALAAGRTPDQILEQAGRIGRRDVAAPVRLAPLRGLFLPSLLRAEPLRRTIAALVPVGSFAELGLPLTVTAVDPDDGSVHRFGAGGQDAPLVDVLYAACALPVFYPPGRIAGRRYVDGGLRGPLPLDAATDIPADLIVALDAGPGFDEVAVPRGAASRLVPLVQAHSDALGITMAALVQEQLARWQSDPERPLLHVRPRVERYATFRVDRLAEYFAEGERAMREVLAARRG